MPRSSRHKSSKHSSREVRDYSDSEKEREKESVSREKKGRDDSRHLKESTTSSEKRKSESKSMDVNKDSNGGTVVIVDYADEYGASSASKKRKEKEEDDRWRGGEWDGIDVSKSDSKRSSRREESSVAGFDGEEGKRSGGKVESKHHRSDRKERGEKEGGSERDRKSSKGERLGDGVTGNENLGSEGGRKSGGGEDRGGKLGVHNNNNDKNKNNTEEDLRNPEPEREIDRRVKRKRDGLGDGDKHQDGARELDDRRLSRDEMSRSGKYKDEAHKDERIRDRYQDTDSWHEDDKQRDNRATREYNSGRSEEKHLKSDKKDLEVSQKKSKAQGNEYDREADRERDRDRDRDRDHHDRERGRERDRDRERDRSRHERERDRDRDRVHDDRDHDLERDRDQERDPERIHNRETERERERGRDRYYRERDRERIRDRDHNHDRSRDRDYDHDHDYASHVDDKGSKYKDDRGRRRSPDVYDDYYGDKSRRVEMEADKDRSLSRKARLDNFMSNSRRKASPSSRTYASTDKYRDGIQDESKYGDSLRDGVASEIHDKVPKNRSGEKRTKFDENFVGELSERSPSTKASPAGLKERSPSASIDRRFQNRTTRRRSLDVDEAERKSSGSNDIRDAPFNEDRQVRELSAKKPSGEEYSRAESPFHHKSSHGNMSSHGPGSLGFRSGADSPSYMGSLGDDNRGHSGSRFRRSNDPNVGRGPGNAWKGAPNWPSPLPNGFLPFPPGPPGPHGPHHGGFPTMLPQFPPIFGVRPSMDINHPGMPYHMGDGDRFPANVRSIGWQNMVDGPVPPHFHGWDVSNSLLRDESGMYGPGHPANAHRRDMNAEMWKSNGDVNLEFTSVSQKESQTVKASMDEVSSAQGASKPHVENSCLEEGASKMNTPSGPSSTKDIPMTPAKAVTDKTPESSSIDDTSNSVRAYLAKLDISMDMTDPDLYNQFINLAIKGEPEYVDEVELEYNEDKAVFKSEIRDLTMGLTFSPTVKDSVFQKAMDLYKRQSANRSFSIPEGDKLRSHPTSHQGVEQTSVLDEKADSIVELGAKKEEPNLVVPEGISATPVVKGNGDDALNDGPLPSFELAHDLGGQVLAPVITEKMDENDVDKGLLSVESAYSDANELKTDPEIVSNNGKRGSGLGGGSEPTSKEPLNTGVSGDLVLSRDSVKVCEALNLVSNESHTGILSRIHNAPESTH